VFGFFYLQNGLSEFISGFFSGPKYFMMGWGALPFPDFIRDFFFLLKEASWSWVFIFVQRDIAFYFPVVLYIGLLSYYVIKIWFKQFYVADFPYFACLLFGIILFNSTLARSDEPHLIFVSLPVVVLSIKILEYLVQKQRGGKFYPSIIAIPLAVSMVLGLGSLLLTNEAQTKMLAIGNRVSGHYPHALQFINSGGDTRSFEVLQIERGKGLFVPRPYASSMDHIVSFINENARPDEPIFAFPDEAIWYFLTGRPNATSYALSQHMITRKQRQEAVSQLKTNKPRYVIFGTAHGNRTVDNMLINQQNPEVLRYLQEHYKAIKAVPGVIIGERLSNP
jgi:hypothetical protein